MPRGYWVLITVHVCPVARYSQVAGASPQGPLDNRHSFEQDGLMSQKRFQVWALGIDVAFLRAETLRTSVSRLWLLAQNHEGSELSYIL